MILPTMLRVSTMLRVLLQLDMRALVIQFYEGRWRASLRTSTGISMIVDGDDPLAALCGLLERVSARRA